MQPLEAVENHLLICLTTELAGRKSQERHWGGGWVIVLQQQGEGTGVSHLRLPHVLPLPHLISEWQFYSLPAPRPNTPGVGVGSTKMEGGRNFEPLDMLIRVQTWPHDHYDHAMLFRGPGNSEDWPEKTLMDMNLEKANHAKQWSGLSATPFHPSFSSELPSWRGTRIGRSRGKAMGSSGIIFLPRF